jgi:UDP-N-acetylmuramate--alanine ligase
VCTQLIERSHDIVTINSDLLNKVKRIHFVGIGGAGMCALAEIMHSKGYALTGSDNNESDTLSRIRKLGIPVKLSHLPENIGDAQLIVHTAAVHDDNAELVEARRRGIPVIDRAVMLGLLSDRYARSIAVSGTHGKTTTTCMLTQILLTADLDPTAVIGGKLPLIGGNSRVGESQLMTCEACEFNDSFLHIHPAISVILNIDNDHLEYFKTVENLIAHFHTFAGQTSEAVIYNGDDANTLKALGGITARKLSFGFGPGCDYRAERIKTEPGSHCCFELMKGDGKLASVRLRVPGKHNIMNALAAAAAADYAGAPAEAIEKGLNDYAGAGRRFELLGKINGITVADDYAHHPTELEVTLTAAKGMGYKRVWAVFQPFTFSRTAMLLDDFARVLQIANRVVLAEIMGSREKNTYNIYSKDLAEKIPGSVWFPDFQGIADYVLQNAADGDLVITLGCGDIYKAAKLMFKQS